MTLQAAVAKENDEAVEALLLSGHSPHQLSDEGDRTLLEEAVRVASHQDASLPARRIRTILLAATKEDKWVQELSGRLSEDEDFQEDLAAEAAKPWYRREIKSPLKPKGGGGSFGVLVAPPANLDHYPDADEWKAKEALVGKVGKAEVKMAQP